MKFIHTVLQINRNYNKKTGRILLMPLTLEDTGVAWEGWEIKKTFQIISQQK